jgi:hypothetical protein
MPTIDQRGFMQMGVPATDIVRLNDTEQWDLINTTVDAHPMHLHLVQFQVVSRQTFTSFVSAVTDTVNGIFGQPSYTPTGYATTATSDAQGVEPWEAGWKDTIDCPPGLVTTIKAKFDIAGDKYVYHCHILSHEEHDMMRPLRVVAPTKVGIFANGAWYLDMNGNHAWDGTPTDALNFFGTGLSGAVPATGDWTGTGSVKMGLYANGTWYLDLNGNGVWDGTPADALNFFGVGLAGAVPATGDWTGTGSARMGLYANGTWYLDLNGNGAWDGTPTDALYTFGAGISGAVPVTGDWNGTGIAKVGLFVPATGQWFLDTNGNGAWDSTPTDTLSSFGSGLAGTVPVTGDWNGSGTTKVGLFVPSTGEWFLDSDGSGAWNDIPTDTLAQFGAGLSGIVPVAGKW